MGNPLIIIGMVALLVVALLGLMASRRKRQGNADEVMDRMGRFATREEFLAVSEGGDKRAPNKIAQGLEEVFRGKQVANTTAALITRADVKLTIGEFILMRIAAAAGGFALGFLFAVRSAPALGVLVGIVFGFVGYF